jgi:ribonuclease BN (tRNA processing enzyme)
MKPSLTPPTSSYATAGYGTYETSPRFMKCSFPRRLPSRKHTLEIKPFIVMKDDKVTVTATLVPHGPVFPAFAYRFDTKYGSVTFSGDTTKSTNLITLA